MKTILIVPAFLISTLFGFGQIKIGVQAGSVLVNGTEEYTDPYDHSNNFSLDLKAQPGVMVGVVADFPMGSDLSLRTALNANYQNSKVSEVGYVGKYHTIYSEIPLSLIYNMKTGPGSIFLGGGANLGVGIWGEFKDNQDNRMDIKFDGDNEAIDDNMHFNRANLALGVNGGYKLDNGIFFEAGYYFGISNMSPYDNTTDRFNQLNLKIGYFLW